MNYKKLLIFSVLINVILIITFCYKLYNNWFEIAVLKLPFRTSIFNSAPKTGGGMIYFVGDSHTEAFELYEYLQNPLVRNRGIWGDKSLSVCKRIDEVAESKPFKIFIMIGINDIISGIKADEVVKNVETTVTKIKRISPSTRIFLQSILPCDHNINRTNTSCYSTIVTVNSRYKQLASNEKIEYLNLFPYFTDHKKKKLLEKYSFDGLHMNGNGYRLWSKLVKPYLR